MAGQEGPKLRLIHGLGQVALDDASLGEAPPAADSEEGPTPPVAEAADGCVMGTSPDRSLQGVVKEDPGIRPLSSILTRSSPCSWDPKKAHELAGAALKAFAEVVLRDNTGEDAPGEVRLS